MELGELLRIYRRDANVSAEIFYAAMQADLQHSNEIYGLLAHFKDEILRYIKSKPTNDMFAYQLLKGALDLDKNKNSIQPLGKIFWVKRGLRACRAEAGILKEAKEELDRRSECSPKPSVSQNYATFYGKKSSTQLVAVDELKQFGP